MAGFREPGVAGVANSAASIDQGTLARTTSPPPGIVGNAPTQDLSEHDLDLIRTTAGRTIGGSRMPLDAVRHSRELHVLRQAAAAREFGPYSWAALFEQATIDCLNALIAEAESPSGKAADRVRTLTEQLKESGSVAVEEELTKALTVLFQFERQRQLMGEEGDSETMPLAVAALNAAGDRRKNVLSNLIDQAKRDRASVTDEQLQKAITDVLSVERERQLLGVEDGESGADSMLLVNEAAKLGERKSSSIPGPPLL